MHAILLIVLTSIRNYIILYDNKLLSFPPSDLFNNCHFLFDRQPDIDIYTDTDGIKAFMRSCENIQINPRNAKVFRSTFKSKWVILATPWYIIRQYAL